MQIYYIPCHLSQWLILLTLQNLKICDNDLEKHNFNTVELKITSLQTAKRQNQCNVFGSEQAHMPRQSEVSQAHPTK